MAEIATPTQTLSATAWVQGRVPAVFSGVGSPARPAAVQRDWRQIAANTSGTITDQVVLKSGATETPFVNGRVWLLRLADGYKAWEGWSDAGGWYTATGLEVGVDYVAVAIDPLRNHKTTGAGPVTAT